MNSDERNRFYLIWTLAVLLCFFVAMFAALFTSCSKQDLSQNRQPPAVSEDTEPLPFPEGSF